MSLIDYNLTVPAANNNPSIDQPNMLINTVALNTIWNVDHYPFKVNFSGQHKQVTMYNQSTPSLGSANGQLFCNSNLPQWQNVSGVFTIALLNAVSFATNGYVNLGGFILQWGVVNGTHGANNTFSSGDFGTVTFATANIIFPNNCFGVTTNLMYNFPTTGSPGETSNIAIDQSTLSRSSFTWTYPENSGVYTRFFWIAIGN